MPPQGFPLKAISIPSIATSSTVHDRSTTEFVSHSHSTYQLRPPRRVDAESVWRCVKETGVLEANTAYAYLLFCEHFSETCLVAQRDSETVGVVIGYRCPDRPDVLFVWQIGVVPSAQRQGLARRMLEELLNRAELRDIRYVEATVDAANHASRQLFTSIANARHVPIRAEAGFVAANFDGLGHAAEPLIRIGPFPAHRGREAAESTEPLGKESHGDF